MLFPNCDIKTVHSLKNANQILKNLSVYSEILFTNLQ